MLRHGLNRQLLDANAGPKIFGADAAENDQNLRDYFIRTAAWHAVLSGRALVVLGRKGSGKSAIFKMLCSDPPENTTVVPISPRVFALDVLNAFVDKYPASPFNREVAYIAAWRYSILLELMMSIERDSNSLFRIGGVAGVHEWLRQNIEYNEDIVSRLVSFFERWTVDKVNLGQLTVAISKIAASRRAPIVGQDIDAVVPEIQDALKRKKYIIAIDNLDEGWANTEDARVYLVGLILAAKELSRIHNLNVVVFMRTDMYRVLETTYQHMDKFRESIARIEWNPTALYNLICMRMRHYYSARDEDNNTTWSRLFPTVMGNNFSTYKHMIERTFLRPREIIQFCRQTVDVASRYGKTKVEERDIRDAESTYADWKITDLSGEFSAYYHGVSNLLYCFRRNTPDIDSAELVDVVKSAIEISKFRRIGAEDNENDVMSVTRFLYTSGFLRAKIFNNKWKYITSAIDPNLVCEKIAHWDIHPAFRKQIVDCG